jgi:osomolarity two-component system, response regulator SSK1
MQLISSILKSSLISDGTEYTNYGQAPPDDLAPRRSRRVVADHRPLAARPGRDLSPMAVRKVWVKRASASATQVAIGPDDLVDDVRDGVIRKYLNSLGRTFDAPDVTLKVCPREHTNKAGHERMLAPDEPIARLIDAYFPGGQHVEEALIIDVPQRQSPNPSPRSASHTPAYYISESMVPGEAGGYFPPMPTVQSPHLGSHQVVPASHVTTNHPHPVAVLANAGQLPPLLSPGSRSSRHRPKFGRQHTTSPTALHNVQPSSITSGMCLVVVSFCAR